MVKIVPVEQLTISKFKATCLAVLERVRKTGEPVLITKRGEPIAEVVPVSRRHHGRRRLGGFAERGAVAGDIISPVVDRDDWDSFQV